MATTFDYASIDRSIATAEIWANRIGWIPLASRISGYLRYLFGQVELIAGLALGIFKFLQSMYTQNSMNKMESQLGFHYAVHGLGNMGRGIVEMFVGLNLLCALYDFLGPRMNYPHETVGPGTNPIFTSESSGARWNFSPIPSALNAG